MSCPNETPLNVRLLSKVTLIYQNIKSILSNLETIPSGHIIGSQVHILASPPPDTDLGVDGDTALYDDQGVVNLWYKINGSWCLVWGGAGTVHPLVPVSFEFAENLFAGSHNQEPIAVDTGDYVYVAVANLGAISANDITFAQGASLFAGSHNQEPIAVDTGEYVYVAVANLGAISANDITFAQGAILFAGSHNQEPIAVDTGDYVYVAVASVEES